MFPVNNQAVAVSPLENVRAYRFFCYSQCAMVFMLLAFLLLTACGRKGRPVPPDGTFQQGIVQGQVIFRGLNHQDK
jgi:hypothetical protein